MIENWNEVLDEGGFGGALLTNSRKFLDFLKRDFIGIHSAYGCDSESLKFGISYACESSHWT